MQTSLLTKRIDPTRVTKLLPLGCEFCAEPACVEIHVDAEYVTRVHRVCEECAKMVEF